MTNHPNRGTGNSGALIPARLLTLARLLGDANRRVYSRAEPPAHESAWRRDFALLTGSVAARQVGFWHHQFGSEALHALLDLEQIAREADRDLRGAVVHLDYPDEDGGTFGERVTLHRREDHWVVAAAPVDSPPAPSPRLTLTVVLPRGARCRLVRRTGHSRGEPAHELVVLPLVEQC